MTLSHVVSRVVVSFVLLFGNGCSFGGPEPHRYSCRGLVGEFPLQVPDGWRSVVYDIATTAEGQVVVAGGKREASRDWKYEGIPLITAYSADGKQLWTRTVVGANVSSTGHFSSVVARPDGSILACGEFGDRHEDPARQSVLAMLGRDGSTLWARVITPQDLRVMAMMCILTEAGVTSDGDIVAVGRAKSPDARRWLWLVARWRRDGPLLWARTYDDKLTRPYVNGMALDNDGSVYVKGREGHEADIRWMVRKVNARGEVEWASRFKSERPYTKVIVGNIATCNDGCLVLAGSRAESPGDHPEVTFIQKRDSNGELLWDTQAPHPGVPHDVAVDEEGMVFVAGRYESTDNPDELWWPVVLKYSPDGELLGTCSGLRKGELSGHVLRVALASKGVLIGNYEMRLKGRDPAERDFIRILSFR